MSDHYELLVSKYEDNVKTALEEWHDHSDIDTTLDHLRLYKEIQKKFDYSPRQATNQILLDGLAALEIEDEKQGKLLRLRFLDRQTIYTTGNQLNMAESTVYLNQRKSVTRLTELLLQMEAQSQEGFLAAIGNRIEPPTYSYLVGAQKNISALTKILLKKEPPWIVTIEGLGGMGKTTLANTLIQHAIQEQTFDDFGWITARQAGLDLGGTIFSVENPLDSAHMLIEDLFNQLMDDTIAFASLDKEQKFTMLQNRLKQLPHLIVIDNLETLSDIEILLPMLKKLVNPSRFILTSRERHYSDAGVYRFPIPALTGDEAVHLIRQEAALSNIPHMDECADDDLYPIYETVGGNPLALRLVVGQIYTHTLNVILENLKNARGEKTENLYTYIYRSAWDSLKAEEKLVFLAMPMSTPQGGDLEFLSVASGVSVEQVSRGLEKLMKLNLVDSYGGLNERRYAIHNLTRTFLQEQVAKWEES